MPNRYLTGIKRVVLQPGHGQGDPGAVANGFSENTENNQIVARLARILRFNGIDTVIDPDLNLVNAINYVNRNYKFGSEWVIEIHKDSAPGVSPDQLRNRVGIYFYGGDKDSQAIAEEMVGVIKNNGASLLSWVRPDTVARFGRLGWIRDTIPLAHLIECGFIQDSVTDQDDEKYAKWVAKAICTALGKNFKYDLDPEPIPSPPNPPTPPGEPWTRIPDFDSLPNNQYYKNIYRNSDWFQILSDIYNRDREIENLKNQLNNHSHADFESKIKENQDKISNLKNFISQIKDSSSNILNSI